MWKKVKWALALAGVPAALALWACLNEPSAPELSGPSELAASLEMRAIPDQLTADGWSSSVIEVIYRNENGQRTSGQTIHFDLRAKGASTFSDIGNLAPLHGPRPVAGGTEASAVSDVTDSEGVARARYWAPFRTDQENDTTVTITSRPAGTNFRAAWFRTVDIFLRAANRPSFPGSNVCQFVIEPLKLTYDVNELIFFTASQLIGDDSVDGCVGNPIARYEWDFGDGNTAAPNRNVEHSYSRAGTYTVILYTTEQGTGCQVGCATSITVQ
jgi:hypothetical protein